MQDQPTSVSTVAKSQRAIRWAPLFLLLLIGGTLRSNDLAWDESLRFHPDERNLVEAAARLRMSNGWNPEFHAYNGFSIYLFRGVSEGVGWLAGDGDFANDPGHVVLVGRALSALCATLSIAMFFWLGYRIGGEAVAMWTACFATFNVGLIQAAHFATTENLLVLELLILSVLVSFLGETRKTTTLYIIIGIVLGVSIGTKTSALAFSVLPLVVVTARFGRRFSRDAGELREVVRAGAIIFGLAGLLFFLASPYSILDLKGFLSSMKYEGGVVSGTRDVFYTLQFIGKTDYLYPLMQLRWYCGTLVLLASLVGLLMLCRDMQQCRTSRAALPILVFSLLYFAYVGQWHAKFIRYLIPMVPAVCLTTAFLVARLWQAPKLVWWSRTIALAILLESITWSAMFQAVYLHRDPRLAASEWIRHQIQPGSTCLYEETNYPPLPQPALQVDNLSLVGLDVIAPDTEAKIQTLAEKLSVADYLVITSRRYYQALPQANGRFPLMSAYYRRLFEGELGYELVAEFESKPGLGNWTVDESWAEETFKVFDHPRVLIFENAQRLNAEHITRQIVE